MNGIIVYQLELKKDQWILDLCNGTVKEVCIPENWKSKCGKDDPMECGSNRRIKWLEHAMKVVERILEYRIWQQIETVWINER